MTEWVQLSSDQRRTVRRAVGRGRRVDDLELAPAAVALAQRYQARPYRTVVPQAIAVGVGVFAARFVIWGVLSREDGGSELVEGLVGMVVFVAVYLLVGARLILSRARRAEGCNAKAVDSG
ncbi:MAG: hypothetical protein ACR2G7_07325 [Acidimicrobiales bacterium]